MQLHLFVSGIVQGVGFRQFVKSEAKKLGITGWTKNLPDGKVEVVAQGEKGSLEVLLAQCKEGPMLADVKDILVQWENRNEPFSNFSIC